MFKQNKQYLDTIFKKFTNFRKCHIISLKHAIGIIDITM